MNPLIANKLVKIEELLLRRNVQRRLLEDINKLGPVTSIELKDSRGTLFAVNHKYFNQDVLRGIKNKMDEDVSYCNTELEKMIDPNKIELADSAKTSIKSSLELVEFELKDNPKEDNGEPFDVAKTWGEGNEKVNELIRETVLKVAEKEKEIKEQERLKAEAEDMDIGDK